MLGFIHKLASKKRKIEIAAVMIAQIAELDKPDQRGIQKKIINTLLSVCEYLISSKIGSSKVRSLITRSEMASILRSVARKIDPPHRNS